MLKNFAWVSIFILLLGISSFVRVPITFATSVIYENFDDGDANDGAPLDWEEVLNQGSWTIQTGRYVGTSASGVKGPISFAGDVNWENYILEADISGLQGVDRHILFRYDPNRTWEGYTVKYLEDEPGFNGHIILVKNKSGDLGVSGQILAINNEFKSHIGESHKFRIEALNNHIKVYTDNILRIDYVDNDNPILQGKIGLFVQRSRIGLINQTAYDNITVSNLNATKLPIPFFDGFENGHYDNWKILSNSCKFNSLPAFWQVNAGQLGIKINGGACSTFLMPNSTPIHPDSDYLVETDMIFSTSTNMDRNLIIKFKDLQNWYGLHFIGNSVFLDKVVGGTEYILPNRQFNYSFESGKTYKIKAEILGNSFKVYINDTLVHTVLDQSPFFPHEIAGLAASAGGIPNSEVWFDNFKIEEINDDIVLAVPNLKQGGIGVPWDSEIYNNYSDSEISQTIRRWGCYLTSAAMLMQFHNYQVNPSQLNNILKTNNGYTLNHGVNLSTLAAYTQKLNPINHLEYKYYAFSFQKLDEELEAGRPVILKLEGIELPFGTHFIVVKGKEGNDYLINDPEPTSTKTKLSDYNPVLYTAIRTLIPSQSDFSYFNIYTSFNVSPEVYKHDGTKLEAFNYVEGPIQTQDGSGLVSGDPLIVFSNSKPASGPYTVRIVGEGLYTSEIQLYKPNGELQHKTIRGIVSDSISDEINVLISDQNEITFHTTIYSVIKDLESAFDLGHIKNENVYNLINLQLHLAKRQYERGDYVSYQKQLGVSIMHIKHNTPTSITTETSNLLQLSIESLQLSN